MQDSGPQKTFTCIHELLCVLPQVSGSPPECSVWTCHEGWGRYVVARREHSGGLEDQSKGPSCYSGSPVFPGLSALGEGGQKPPQLHPATKCHMPGSWLLARVTAVPYLRGQALARSFREWVTNCRSY